MKRSAIVIILSMIISTLSPVLAFAESNSPTFYVGKSTVPNPDGSPNYTVPPLEVNTGASNRDKLLDSEQYSCAKGKTERECDDEYFNKYYDEVSLGQQ